MPNVLTIVFPPGTPVVKEVAVPGIQGPANTLTIGTVAAVDPTATATATITGASPNQTLNLSIPRGRGIIPGGASGQFLAKASNTDYDMVWQSMSGHTHTASQISDSTATGRSVLTATDASAARTAIGAGTSSLVIGTTNTTAKAGDYTPPSDAVAGTASMRTLGTGAQQAAAGNHSHTPASIGAATATHTHGVTDLTATGTRDSTTYLRGDNTWAAPPGGAGGSVTDASTTAKGIIQLANHLGGTAAAPTVVSGAGHGHTASQISDSTATGRSVITATDAAAARTAIGAGTSNLAIGTTSTTAKAGDYTPPSDAVAATASMRTLGTGAQQAAAGNHTHTGFAATSHTHAVSDMTATGTRDATTFLRGDNTWATPAGGASVVDASTTAKGIVQLANHLGGTATAPTVRTTSTSQTGIVQLATTAEASTGTDATKAVTPAGLKTVADTKVTNAGGVTNIRLMTQAAYDALGTKDAATLYVIQG